MPSTPGGADGAWFQSRLMTMLRKGIIMDRENMSEHTPTVDLLYLPLGYPLLLADIDRGQASFSNGVPVDIFRACYAVFLSVCDILSLVYLLNLPDQSTAAAPCSLSERDRWGSNAGCENCVSIEPRCWRNKPPAFRISLGARTIQVYSALLWVEGVPEVSRDREATTGAEFKRIRCRRLHDRERRFLEPDDQCKQSHLSALVRIPYIYLFAFYSFCWDLPLQVS
jgi:hypothetical protein